jgi:hypothetical protein
MFQMPTIFKRLKSKISRIIQKISMSKINKKQQEIINFIKIQLVQLENCKTNDERVLICFIIFDYIINNIDLIQTYETPKWIRFKSEIILKYKTILQSLNERQSYLNESEYQLFILLIESHSKMSILM